MKKKFVIVGLIMVMCLGILGGCSSDIGTFYTLSESYENGWLTQNDLQNIAYYY